MERTETLTAASAPGRVLAGSCVDWAAVLGGAVVAAATAGLSTISAEPGEVSDEDGALLIAAAAQETGLTEAERLAQQARQAAINAAETARISAIVTAFLLTAAALVAAAAAVIGAFRGGRHRDEGRLYGGLGWS